MVFATGLEGCLLDPPEVVRTAERFGVLLNECSLTPAYEHAHLALARALPGSLTTLFGPQHGFLATEQDNMIETPHSVDPMSGARVFSLYSETRTPSPAMLEDIDVLLVDLQDVGCRVYTYIWTLHHCMQACAAACIPVVVLDRPNPIGGTIAEGPLLPRRYRSFVGEASIPLRHGLTIGELARLLNAEHAMGCDLHVVPMAGWSRSSLWRDAGGRDWLPPSPNLARLAGVQLYPGAVLLEGTRLSEGRGTTTPFEVVGAPGVDAVRLATDVGEVPGAILRPTAFVPTFQKHAGNTCSGVFVHVTDPVALRPVELTVRLLRALRRQDPVAMTWREPPYEYEEDLLPIDILAGGPWLREWVDSDTAPPELDVDAWWERVEPYRLY